MLDLILKNKYVHDVMIKLQESGLNEIIMMKIGVRSFLLGHEYLNGKVQSVLERYIIYSLEKEDFTLFYRNHNTLSSYI